MAIRRGGAGGGSDRAGGGRLVAGAPPATALAAVGCRAGGQRQAGARSSVEFYRRFEQIVARVGLQRAAGQTPREFAGAAGTRLAAVSGRHELYAWAVQVAESLLQRPLRPANRLDASAAQGVEQALEELTAGTISQ